MKTATFAWFMLCCTLLCSVCMAAPHEIRVDFASGVQGYSGPNWDWSSTEGIPPGSMRQIGNFTTNLLTKTPVDAVIIDPPSIVSVTASLQAMSSNGMGGVDMTYRLTYSDSTSDVRTLGIFGIGGYGYEWKPADEAFVTAKPVASIELVSFSGFAPGFGDTCVFVDAANISATALGPVYAISNRAARASMMQTVSPDFRFKLYGRVTLMGDDWFSLDDGSGAAISVFAEDYSGIATGDYASAVGRLDTEADPPTLLSSAESVLKLH